MNKCVYKSDFSLEKIDAPDRAKYIAKRWRDLSEFQKFALRLVGDVLRSQNSTCFWNDGCYSWYADPRKCHEQRVWMTETGIAMFEDCQTDEVFCIVFI